jgi:hypothetical protein
MEELFVYAKHNVDFYDDNKVVIHIGEIEWLEPHCFLPTTDSILNDIEDCMHGEVFFDDDPLDFKVGNDEADEELQNFLEEWAKKHLESMIFRIIEPIEKVTIEKDKGSVE